MHKRFLLNIAAYTVFMSLFPYVQEAQASTLNIEKKNDTSNKRKWEVGETEELYNQINPASQKEASLQQEFNELENRIEDYKSDIQEISLNLKAIDQDIKEVQDVKNTELRRKLSIFKIDEEIKVGPLKHEIGSQYDVKFKYNFKKLLSDNETYVKANIERFSKIVSDALFVPYFPSYEEFLHTHKDSVYSTNFSLRYDAKEILEKNFIDAELSYINLKRKEYLEQKRNEKIALEQKILDIEREIRKAEKNLEMISEEISNPQDEKPQYEKDEKKKRYKELGQIIDYHHDELTDLSDELKEENQDVKIMRRYTDKEIEETLERYIFQYSYDKNIDFGPMIYQLGMGCDMQFKAACHALLDNIQSYVKEDFGKYSTKIFQILPYSMGKDFSDIFSHPTLFYVDHNKRYSLSFKGKRMLKEKLLAREVKAAILLRDKYIDEELRNRKARGRKVEKQIKGEMNEYQKEIEKIIKEVTFTEENSKRLDFLRDKLEEHNKMIAKSKANPAAPEDCEKAVEALSKEKKDIEQALSFFSNGQYPNKEKFEKKLIAFESMIKQMERKYNIYTDYNSKIQKILNIADTMNAKDLKKNESIRNIFAYLQNSCSRSIEDLIKEREAKRREDSSNLLSIRGIEYEAGEKEECLKEINELEAKKKRYEEFFNEEK